MRPKYHRADFLNLRYNRNAYERRVIYPTDPKFTEAFGYLVAFCLRKCRLEVYALTLFFNHEHGDLGHPEGDRDPETRARFSDFFELFHCWGHRLLKRNGWSYGPVYCPIERTHDAPCLDAERILDALIYDMAQAVKAGLYKRSADYPGLCLLPENVTTPRVFQRNELIHALDPDGTLFPDAELSILLGVPAPFRHLGRQAYQELLQARLDAYEAEHASPKADKKRGDRACASAILGKRFTKHLHRLRTRGKLPPHRDTPGPPPPYTSKPELRRAFFEERRFFWDQHEEAARRFRSGERDVVFPAGTYGRARTLNVVISCTRKACWADQEPFCPD